MVLWPLRLAGWRRHPHGAAAAAPASDVGGSFRNTGEARGSHADEQLAGAQEGSDWAGEGDAVSSNSTGSMNASSARLQQWLATATPAAMRIHLLLFYFQGRFLDPAKRLLDVRLMKTTEQASFSAYPAGGQTR